jgi:sugar O-acyltransferase (sialic acid O-acetyltransferase NeuD family)
MHPKTDIILYGGGGHCMSVIDVIEATGQYRIAGIVDIKAKVGQKVSGYEIIGSDEDIARLAQTYKTWCVTIGQIKGAAKRMESYRLFKNLGLQLPSIISPLSYVSKNAVVMESTVVMHHVLINAGAQVGVNCIINTKALLEHEVRVGHHCHISTSAVLNGQVTVGDECFIGSRAVVKNGITIHNNVIAGAGAVVLNEVAAGQTVAGNPAKIITV